MLRPCAAASSEVGGSLVVEVDCETDEGAAGFAEGGGSVAKMTAPVMTVLAAITQQIPTAQVRVLPRGWLS